MKPPELFWSDEPLVFEDELSDKEKERLKKAEFAFNPDEPRDEKGKWTYGADGTSAIKVPNALSDFNINNDLLSEMAESGNKDDLDYVHWMGNLTSNEAIGIRHWIGSETTCNMMRQIEKGKIPAGAGERQLVSDFTSALDKCPKYKGECFRGTDEQGSWKPSPDLKVGSIITLKADTSASTDREVPADSFYDGLMLNIKTKSAADLDSRNVISNEHEVVLRKDSRYEVTSVNQAKTSLYHSINLREI